MFLVCWWYSAHGGSDLLKRQLCLLLAEGGSVYGPDLALDRPNAVAATCVAVPAPRSNPPAK